MGLFNSKKKKNTKDEGLLGFIKKNLKDPSDENVLKALEAIAKPDDDLDHLTPEGELPWGWLSHTKEFRGTIENEYSYFLNNWISSRQKDVDPLRKYEALKSFVLYLEDVEKLCKSKGECFEFWFDEILTSPGYLEKRKQELHALENEIKGSVKDGLQKP